MLGRKELITAVISIHFSTIYSKETVRGAVCFISDTKLSLFCVLVCFGL